MTYNIIYASDDNYCQYMGVSIISLFETNVSIPSIDVYIFNNNISNINISHLNDIAKIYNRNIYFIDCNIAVELLSDISSDWNIGTFLRLFLDLLLPSSVDKALYLDCDIIINKSLEALYNEDISDFFVAGVPDIYNSQIKIKHKMSDKDVYVNAGILLINLVAWRKSFVSDKFMQYLSNKSSILQFPDQDAINVTFKDKIKILPMQYNQTMFSLALPYKYARYLMEPFSLKYFDENDYIYAQENPVIIHYAGSLFGRPWNHNSKQPCADLYLKYLAISPWSSAKPLRRIYTNKKLSSLYVFITESILKLFWVNKCWFVFVPLYDMFNKLGLILSKIKRIFC